MSQLITHFCQFADAPTAQAALASYGAIDPLISEWAWRTDIVDAGIPITQATGQTITDQMTGQQYPGRALKAGYFINIALAALNTSLPGLTGAGYRDPTSKAWVTLYGTAPIAAPQREFAF